MRPNRQFPAGLFTFTEEILNGKLHFFVKCRFRGKDGFYHVSLVSAQSRVAQLKSKSFA